MILSISLMLMTWTLDYFHNPFNHHFFFNRNLALKIQLAYDVVLFIIVVKDIVHLLLQEATKTMERQCHEHNLEIQVFVVHVPIFYSKALKVKFLVKKNSPSLYIHLFHNFFVLTHNIWMVGVALLVCHKSVMHWQWIISNRAPTPTNFVSCDAMLNPNWSCYPNIKYPSRSSLPTSRYLPENNF
jgi:hypothetical protein